MFKVEVIGNLGADAVIKDANGTKFVSFRVAHSEKWTDTQGKEQSRTTWIDCTMSDVQSGVIPYLKQGTKVFVRGNATLRVYSSKQDRMMKAGCQVAVREVELCGGQMEDVPRHIIDPDSAVVYPVYKAYYVQADTKGWRKDDVKTLVDAHGGEYLMNKQCFVVPKPVEQEQPAETAQTNS